MTWLQKRTLRSSLADAGVGMLLGCHPDQLRLSALGQDELASAAAGVSASASAPRGAFKAAPQLALGACAAAGPCKGVLSRSVGVASARVALMLTPAAALMCAAPAVQGPVRGSWYFVAAAAAADVQLAWLHTSPSSVCCKFWSRYMSRRDCCCTACRSRIQ
jgi:hypothetical protein